MALYEAKLIGIGGTYTYEQEVEKEYYEEWYAKKKSNRRSAERERFDACILDGYGLYGWELEERDGRYFEYWSEGTTCD